MNKKAMYVAAITIAAFNTPKEISSEIWTKQMIAL